MSAHLPSFPEDADNHPSPAAPAMLYQPARMRIRQFPIACYGGRIKYALGMQAYFRGQPREFAALSNGSMRNFISCHLLQRLKTFPFRSDPSAHGGILPGRENIINFMRTWILHLASAGSDNVIERFDDEFHFRHLLLSPQSVDIVRECPVRDITSGAFPINP